MQVHIDRGGERFGPYSVGQINAHLADGSILPSDLGWTEGMADWVPGTQVPSVTTADAAAPPPPPAAPGASPTTVGSTCPTCQVPVPADQVVCMGCGTNLQSGQTPALQTTSKSAGNKKLLIGVGAGVGVLALAAAGYFVIYPKLSGDESNQESSDIVGNESTTPMPGDPGFAGGPGGRPQGGFGGQGRPQGGGQQAGFGGKGRPPQGGGFNPMMFDKNKDGKVSKAEVPPQMAGFYDRVDKNKDGKIQYFAGKAFRGKPRFLETRGSEGERKIANVLTENVNELYIDRDIMVLANPEIAGLPGWVIALVAAGGLAAALSTAAGLLLVISTSISHDLLKKIF